jgi:predicted ribosomally synthesized peptide with SipW-like signal peptide
MAVCGSLIAGTTYALFTSTDSVNIAITSGKVEVTAEVNGDSVATYSAVAESNLPEDFDVNTAEEVAGGKDLNKYASTYYYVEQDTGTFKNGGTAVLEDDVLTIDNITPGDKVTFNIDVANNSSVTIQYRTIIECVGDPYLFAGLDFSVGESEFSKVVYYVSDWNTLSAIEQASAKTSTSVPVTISLPLGAEDVFQNRSTKIRYTIEAVQGNAATTDEHTSTTVEFIEDIDNVVKASDGNYLVTIPKDNQKDIVFTDNETFKVTVPFAAIDENAGYLSFSLNAQEEADSKFKGDTTGKIASTYDISLSGIKEDNEAAITVSYLFGTEKEDVAVYHGNELLESTYDAEKGFVTFKTTSFSLFTILEKSDEVVEEKTPSEGLKYKLNSDNASYSVSGIDDCPDTDIVIPSTYNGIYVTAIAAKAFKDNDTITSVIIPDSVTSLGNSIFYNCTKLKTVTIGEGLNSINELAFNGCTSITNFIVSASNESFKSIDGNIYSKDGTQLVKYAIGKQATSFTIPNGVTEICNEAFRGSNILEEVIIGDGVKSIGVAAFMQCSKLTSVIMSDSIEDIQETAFSSCENLTKVIIGKGIKSIYFAFEDCYNLNSVYYNGTKDAWDANVDNIMLGQSSIVVYYYSETQPETAGNYWHYADGEVVVW